MGQSICSGSRKIIYLIASFLISFLLISPNIFCEGTSAQTSSIRKTILDYKKEVGLSDKQLKDIEKLIVEYDKRVASNTEKIKEEDRKLRELLTAEGDIKEIGKKVREIYRLRGEMVVDDLETGRKIDSLLTKEQKDKWKEIRKSNIQSKNNKEKEGSKE